eukprot:142427-Amphidinium_carterae.1
MSDVIADLAALHPVDADGGFELDTCDFSDTYMHLNVHPKELASCSALHPTAGASSFGVDCALDSRRPH